MSHRQFQTGFPCGCESCRPIEPLAMTGFSVQRPPSRHNASVQLNNWTAPNSFYSGQGFNLSTGIYTVPETGRYSIKAIISYKTLVALSISIGSGVDPTFQIRKIPGTTPLISALLPVVNISLALFSIRAVLGSATVALLGDLQLNKGDQIGLFYASAGLNINLDIGGIAQQGTVWSVHRIA